MPLVYKVDNPVKSSLSSSLVSPNTRLPLNPTLRALSYNILVAATYLLSLGSSYTKFVVTNYVGHILRINKE